MKEESLRILMVCLNCKIKVKVMLEIGVKLCIFSYILYTNFKNILKYKVVKKKSHTGGTTRCSD